MKRRNGFTLIEILIGTAVLLVVGAALAGVFASTLRSQTKTDVITSVRQNGNYVTAQMVKDIRNSRQFNGVSTDGTTYVTKCFPMVGAHYLAITGIDGAQSIYSCDTGHIASNGASLVDTTKVKVDSCSISCAQPDVSGTHVLNISFSLSQAGTTNFSDNGASIPFQTSVQIRNENR